MANEIGAIMDKIARLKSLHERPGTPEEAAAAVAAIQRLMRRHNLTQMQVNDATRNTEAGFDKHDVDLGAVMMWRQHLMYVIAESSYCMFIRDPSGRWGTIVGEKHNATMVKELYLYLVDEINRLADVAYAEARDRHFGARTWKNSFRVGAATTVGRRIEDDAAREKQEQTNDNNALVVVYEEGLNKAVSEYFPRLRNRTRTMNVGSADAYGRGKAAGRRINLAKQIGGA